MLRVLIHWLSGGSYKGSSRDHAPTSRGVPHTGTERALGQAQMRLAQAQADYLAAKQIWPRDRKAIDRTWRQFRDARCAQISAEMAR